MADTETREPVRASEATRSERSALASASMWIVVNFACVQGLRFFTNLLLWRMMYPEAFGLMALVTSVLLALQMFSDVGLAPVVVRDPRGAEPRFLNTAWTIQLVRGAILWGAALVLARPMANYYDQPLLVEMIQVAGLSAFIDGFLSTRMLMAQRELRLARLTVLEVTSAVAAAVTMIVAAFFFQSPWVLVGGRLVRSAMLLTLSHTALPGVANRLCWDREAARRIIKFGSWVFLSTILAFGAVQSDRLVFGKLIPIDVLGVYSIAVALAAIPTLLVAPMARRMVFPHLSEQVNLGEPMAPIYVRVRAPVLIVVAWMIAGLIGSGPTAVVTLYGERAAAAGWMVQLLAFGGWFFAIRQMNNSPMLALGYPRWLAAANAAKVAGMLVLIPIGYSVFGFIGALWAYALADVVSYSVTLWALSQHGIRAWKQDLVLSGVTAAVVAASWALGEAVQAMGGPTGLQAVLIVLFTTAAFWVLWSRRERIAQISAPVS